jgi:hypothetical protein
MERRLIQKQRARLVKYFFQAVLGVLWCAAIPGSARAGSSANFVLGVNSYDGPNWWGTISFTNTGPASSSNYRVEFDVPAGAHCTAEADAVPAGAVLSPLTGSDPAHTPSNHCIFTWTNATPLAVNAAKTFNYSTDSQSFTKASVVTLREVSCTSLTIKQNSYDGPNWWGTIKFTNEGLASTKNYKVEFDVPPGAHCTAESDAVPAGAVLSPLTGSNPAHTPSNHCTFTWTNTSALAPGASKTFNYSTDSQSFSAATAVAAAQTTCSDGSVCNGLEVCGGGSCQAGTDLTCNDNNDCTADSCGSTTGCKFTNLAAGTSCGGAQVCDGAGQCKDGPIVEKPLDPSAITPVAGFTPGSLNCGAGLDLGPPTNVGGQPGHQSISYPPAPVDSNPGPSCREKVTFCDDNEVPLNPQPTDADLTNAPAQLVSCPPLSNAPTPADCGVDPATLSGLCTKDSDCATGEVCGVKCLTPACMTVERRCGKLFASCNAPGADQCDPHEFRTCTDPGNVVTVTAAEADQQLPPKTQPDPSASIPPNEQFTPPPFDTLKSVQIQCLPLPDPPKEAKQSSAFSLDLGNKSWGIFLKPFVENHSVVSFPGGVRGFIKGNEAIDIGGAIGYSAGARVFGEEISAASVAMNVSLAECKKTINFEMKIFGEAVATLENFNKFDSAFGNLVENGKGLETPLGDVTDCNAGYTRRNVDGSFLQKSFYIAGQVKEFYLEHGASEDLCKRTFDELKNLGISFTCPSNVNNIDIPNAWINEYKKAADTYAKSTAAVEFGKDKQKLDAQIKLFEIAHPYKTKFPEFKYPLGPVQLIVSLQLFGSWHMFGHLDVGLTYKGSLTNLASEVALQPFGSLFNSLNGPPEVTAIAGPRVEPGLDAGVIAFAGVGIPGVTVGIEGSLSLLDVGLTLDARVGAMRRSDDDTRDRTGTDFAGAIISGFEPKTYSWKYAFVYGGQLTLSTLKGNLDAVARIKIAFFSRTFRKNLKHGNGFSKSFNLVSGVAGDPLTGIEAYGSLANSFAFSDLARLSGTELIANPDVSALYPKTLDRSAPCVIIP